MTSDHGKGKSTMVAMAVSFIIATWTYTLSSTARQTVLIDDLGTLRRLKCGKFP